MAHDSWRYQFSSKELKEIYYELKRLPGFAKNARAFWDQIEDENQRKYILHTLIDAESQLQKVCSANGLASITLRRAEVNYHGRSGLYVQPRFLDSEGSWISDLAEIRSTVSSEFTHNIGGSSSTGAPFVFGATKREWKDISPESFREFCHDYRYSGPTTPENLVHKFIKLRTGFRYENVRDKDGLIKILEKWVESEQSETGDDWDTEFEIELASWNAKQVYDSYDINWKVVIPLFPNFTRDDLIKWCDDHITDYKKRLAGKIPPEWAGAEIRS